MFIFKLKYKSQVWVWKATGRLLSLVRSWCAVGAGGPGWERHQVGLGPAGQLGGPRRSWAGTSFLWHIPLVSEAHPLPAVSQSLLTPHPEPWASQFVSPFWSLHPLAPIDDHAVQFLCLSCIFCGSPYRWLIQTTLFFANISFSYCFTSCWLHATDLGNDLH